MLDLLDAGLPAPVRGVFTTRAGGVSDAPWDALNLARHVDDQYSRVMTNRELLAHELGLESRALVFGKQVHGAGVRLVKGASNKTARGLDDTDGLVTTVPGLVLVMMGADCLPVLLADPVAGVVGAAHVGRLGLAKGVLPEVVRVMREQGATAITAIIGPGICGDCYEVPGSMAGEVEKAVPGSRDSTPQGTTSINLSAGASRQLQSAGVPVGTVGGCTLEQPDRFFSYRRDGVTGRHAGLVWLP